jgi:trehalose/maltose hydrolase-like predicted phosphorylase
MAVSAAIHDSATLPIPWPSECAYKWASEGANERTRRMMDERHPPQPAAQPTTPQSARAAAVVRGATWSPALEREFQMLIFDWDGTAVANRREDASTLARLSEPLLADGCWLVIVTGTNFDNIARQFCDLVAPTCRSRLLVCANRGSEVFGFDERGEVQLRFRRTATEDEDRALTRIAEEVHAAVTHATGLPVEIVYNRLNRRKIDLIPVPEWADPPKAQIGALREAVEARLAAGGWQGGIGSVVALAKRLAASMGIAVRITSDVKHVEVGLTDKADSIAWIQRELMLPRGISEDDVLILGDEFGAIGGFAGSDDRLRAGFVRAPVVSVGVEPSGVPEGVVHLGGGPRAFRELLADQIARRCARPNVAAASETLSAAEGHIASLLAPSSPADEHAGWALRIKGVRPELEHVVESLLAVGNGFIGVRGSLEMPHPVSRPGTLVAGLFGPQPDDPSIPALLSGPDWLRLGIFADGDPITLEGGGAAAHLSRTLDLRRGLLRSNWPGNLPTTASPAPAMPAMPAMPISIQTLRFSSQVRRGLGIQIVRIEALADVTLTLQAWLEPPTNGLRPCDPFTAGTPWQAPGGIAALGCHAEGMLLTDGHSLRPVRQSGMKGTQTWAWKARPGQVATFVRIVSFARRGTPPHADRAAADLLARARAASIDTLLEEHLRAWQALWDAADIEIAGDEEAQRQVRFAIYHLLSAANPDDERVSIAARGLTGEGYLGHVFWDTDIFLIPFYTAVWPSVARALLMYRYHTLPAARARARQHGYRGAFYAWESADTGMDVTPQQVIALNGDLWPVRCGTQEVHISADVAYAAWHYWSATRDRDFLLNAGAEILLETARFWASRCTLEADGRYHIRDVIGPDEYHEEVDDNAYTNGMARWNLRCAITAARLIARRWPQHWHALALRLALSEDDLHHWRDISQRLVTGVSPTDESHNADEPPSLIEQFAGYFRLEPLDLSAYAARTVPMNLILGQARAQQTQVIKQADVVMLLALLPEEFSHRDIEANYRYYERRCDHGSSLSPPIHALVAARLGDLETARRYFHQTAEIDLNETTGAAALGVHMAALGGLWSIVAFGFAGVLSRERALRIEPRLPKEWRSVDLRLHWRGRRLHCHVAEGPRRIRIELIAGAEPVMVAVGRLRHRLSGVGAAWECWWDEAQARWKERSA